MLTSWWPGEDRREERERERERERQKGPKARYSPKGTPPIHPMFSTGLLLPNFHHLPIVHQIMKPSMD
jgi:hypothetical protein